MGIALTMQEYLEDNHVTYDVARHGKTGSSAMTARRAMYQADPLPREWC